MNEGPPFFDGIPEPIASFNAVVVARIDADDRLVEANAGFRSVAGLDEAGAVGAAVGPLFHEPGLDAWRDNAPDGDWTVVHDGIFHVGEPGREASSLEGRVYARDGQLLVVAQHDIDAYRRLKDQVLALNEELTRTERELRRNIRQLKRTERELTAKALDLERSNEALEQFAYVVSHDLQEPLRTIAGYLDLLEHEHGSALDEDAQDLLDEARAGAGRMRSMIKALLAYARVDTEAHALEETDADAALEDALANLEGAIQETQATVERDPLPTVLADRDQLIQLFQNLVGNAIKFAQDAPHVEIRVEREDDAWVFHVRDHGPGIPPDEQDAIFEVFQRGSKEKEGSGTGIGLSVCKRIVDRHGGEIRVESTPGEGATFSFTLPAVQGDMEDTTG